jgi:hypothetical protein
MTLCSTLLAAFACANLRATQVSMSSVPTVNATLIGAAGAEYTLSIPVDMSLVYTSEHASAPNASHRRLETNVGPDNMLSISHIETTGGTCTFCGVNGAEVIINFPGPGTVHLNDEKDVGPPQTIVFAVCT